jgi:hypothetical protein
MATYIVANIAFAKEADRRHRKWKMAGTKTTAGKNELAQTCNMGKSWRIRRIEILQRKTKSWGTPVAPIIQRLVIIKITCEHDGIMFCYSILTSPICSRKSHENKYTTLGIPRSIDPRA